MKDRHKTICAVFLYLTRNMNGEEEVLLQKRINTGYMDGMYDFCSSGHLDANESISNALIREVFEENGIYIKEDDAELILVVHDPLQNYVRFIFKTKEYVGIPSITEPNKCEELTWFPKRNLPVNIIYHVKMSIEAIENGINYDDGTFSRVRKVMV